MFFAINLRNDHHHSTSTAPPSNCKPTIGPPPSLPRATSTQRFRPLCLFLLSPPYAIFICKWE
ncbi:hypothetical protein BVRB_1g006890 [Beta vulgaris subsp. vulgaris]|nr:hypothetical protein BVRB_1g006890 [Beta vulgaris subsp. vulgaris]